MRPLAIAAGFTIFALAGQVQETLRLSLPAYAPKGSCTVERNGTVVARIQAGPELTLQCPGDGDVLRCDLDGAEPLDLPLGDVCRTHALPLQPAEHAAFLTDGRSPVTVQWMRFDTRMGGNPLLATRELAAASRQQIVVSRRDDRFVRLSRPNASPVTIPVAALFGRREFVLPPAVPGGELFARVEMVGVVPERYRLVGDASTEIRPEGDVIALQGVAAGRYRLTPVYPGGVNGRTRPVPIYDARSTAFSILAENVGAVQVNAEESVCREAADLFVTRVTSRAFLGGTTTSRDEVSHIALEAKCAYTVGGLTPSQYDAAYTGPTGTVGTARFTIERGALASVTVAAPAARVFGRVLVNGVPAPDVTVKLVGSVAPPGDPGTKAASDVHGFYDLTVAKPGEYDVSFTKDGIDFLGAERSVRVANGDNELDWRIRAGRLKIAVTGWDRASPLVVTVRRVKMTAPGLTGTVFRVMPADKMPVVVDGLGFDDYRVEARQHDSTPGSPPPDKVGSAPAAIDEDKSEASVEIELKSSDRVLTIVDPEGLPVGGARIPVESGETLREMAPGNYSLADVVPGVPLRIRANGFTPVCRTAAASSQRVQLDRGITVRLRFSGRSDVGDRPVGQLLSPASDCPLGLLNFDYTPVPQATPGVAEFVVTNFPRAEEFVYIAPGWDTPDNRQRARIDADGVVRIRLAPDK